MGVVVMGHDFEVVWEICTSVVDGGGVVRGDSGWRNYRNDISGELFRVGGLGGGDNDGDDGGIFETESGGGGTRGGGGDDVGVFPNCGGASRGGVREGAL